MVVAGKAKQQVIGRVGEVFNMLVPIFKLTTVLPR